MGVTVTPVDAEPHSIKCRICGRAAPRGAKLCEQCKAALKRARQVPTGVSRILPLPIAGAGVKSRDGGHRRALPARRSPWFAAPTAPGTWGACVAIVIFGIAAAVTGYFAVTEIEDDTDRAGVVAGGIHEPAAAPRSATATETTETPAIPADGGETAWDAHGKAARALQSASAASKPNPQTALADSKTARPGAAPSDASMQTPSGESGVARRPAVEARGSAPAANDAPALIEDPPSLQDRWRAMNAELARCSRKNFIAGILCGQRTRWQYCEGFWGQVPQCRVAISVDGGR